MGRVKKGGGVERGALMGCAGNGIHGRVALRRCINRGHWKWGALMGSLERGGVIGVRWAQSALKGCVWEGA